VIITTHGGSTEESRPCVKPVERSRTKQRKGKRARKRGRGVIQPETCAASDYAAKTKKRGEQRVEKI